MKCPGFERLIDYLDGRLASGVAASVAAHLASGCQQCAADREWYERVRTLADTDDTVEPPAWVLKRALRIPDGEHAEAGAVRGFGRMIAKLIFDSFAQPALAGVRSAETANRQLLYRAGDYSIDLQMVPLDQSHADLIGQVLKEGDTGFESVAGLTLDIIDKEEAVRSTTTNEIGEFALRAIDCGEQDLRVETREGSITIVGLPLIHSHQ